MLRRASRPTVGGRYSVAGAACLVLLAAAATNCGGDDSPAAGASGQGGGGAQITCGPGTVLSGTTCVVADAGAAGAAGSSSDGGVVTCGPGTVLKEKQCVPADTVADGLAIDSFTATVLSGDVPLVTSLTWSIRAPQGTKFSCELDTDGDGTFETPVLNCNPVGEYPVTYDTFGERRPAFRVIPEGANGAVQAEERLFANKVTWAQNLVRVHELPGVSSSKVVNSGTVELTFNEVPNVPAIAPGALVWDSRAGGYVRRVTSASASGTTLTLQVTDASIFDIATDGFWGRRDRPEELTTMSLGGDACDPAAFSDAWEVKVENVGDLKIVMGSGFVEVNDGRLLTATRVFDPLYSFGLLQENVFDSRVMVHTRLCAGVELGLEGKLLEKSVPIPIPGGLDLDFQFFHAKGGFVPEVGFEATGKIFGGFDAVLGTFATATIQYMSNHGGFTSSTGLSYQKDAVTGLYNPHVSAEGEVKLFARPAFEVSWNGDDADCDEGKTKGSGAFKMSLEPEAGIRATASATVQSGGSVKACLSAGAYASMTASVVPPLEVIDCVEWGKTFDVPFYEQCWSLSGGAGGADAGGSGGAAGTGGSGTGGAGTGGSSGTGGTGTGGAAGTGGTGTGGATGTGGSGTGGSAGADAGCTPVVNKVTPTAATLNQSTKFFVGGTCLPSSLAFFIADCANLETLSLGSTLALFECTPTKAGALAGVVKDQPGGTKLKDFTVSVTDPGTVNCPNPLVACNGTCTDVLTSNIHCGACNNQCYANEYCHEGTCTAYAVSGQSCNSLAPTCGASGTQSCCATLPVPAGSFPMGDPAITGPEVSATLSGFNLDMFEVTVGRFRRFVEAYPSFIIMPGQGAHPLIPGSGWNSNWPRAADQATLKSYLKCDSTYQSWTDAVGGNENKPVNCVDWYHAFLFCYWDGGRLPTEAEWEYAAAGGEENRQYPWGSADPNLNWLAVFNCLADGSPAGQCSVNDLPNVGYVPAGAGRWGHMDLAGSLWEWGLDWYTNYGTEPCNNCANLTEASNRVLRGGYFLSSDYGLRAAYRSSYDPTDHNGVIGFRCARTP